MILIDGQQFKYVRFPDGTCDYMHDSCTKIENIIWHYQGDLSEAFVCLNLLRNNFVKSCEFIFLPFARQDKIQGFGGLYSFLSMFAQFSGTKFIVNDAHNPGSLPSGWFNHYEAFVTHDDGKSMVVFPDQGAFLKYSNHYAHIPFVYASKKRNSVTGEIVGIVLVGEIPDHIETIYVIDDICDGGKTFIELHPLLPEKPKKHLLTTYGIYSKGKSLLEAYYDQVKCQYQIYDYTEKF